MSPRLEAKIDSTLRDSSRGNYNGLFRAGTRGQRGRQKAGKEEGLDYFTSLYVARQIAPTRCNEGPELQFHKFEWRPPPTPLPVMRSYCIIPQSPYVRVPSTLPPFSPYLSFAPSLVSSSNSASLFALALSPCRPVSPSPMVDFSLSRGLSILLPPSGRTNLIITISPSFLLEQAEEILRARV